MKNRIPPRDEERRLGEQDFIVSRTDLKGRIRYCNRIFMEIAGYAEHELLGRQQNIVRHPDMPRGLFRLLWRSLAEGREVFAYIKNLTRDGAFYWVFANVTTDRDEHGRPTGYYSVRRCPRRDAIATIEPLYRRMLEIERDSPVAEQPDRSLAWLEEHLRDRGVSYDRFVLGI